MLIPVNFEAPPRYFTHESVELALVHNAQVELSALVRCP